LHGALHETLLVLHEMRLGIAAAACDTGCKMSSFFASLSQGVAPELVWGLIPRIVGALFLVAHASLAPQVLGLAGSRGIAPAREQLGALRTHFPGPRRFFDVPTLLWLNASDRFLRALPWIGMTAGALAIYGGPITPFALFIAWISYLSLDVCSLMFPWDCLLLEAGFLALFLPAPEALPTLATSTLPLTLVAFLFRLVLIRLMWGFAKLKFIGTEKGDDLYLRGFLAWMPMCNKLGWQMQHAPAWLLRMSYVFMWCVEVLCPLLAFFGGLPRLIAGVGLIALMGGIWATGNWGFFNLAYGALCFALFDTQTTIVDLTLAEVTGRPLTHALLAVLAFGALIYFPFNSWCSQTWIQWPFDDVTYKRPLLGWLVGFYRFLAPFRVVNSYGVFPPGSSPPIKTVPVIEGSRDGKRFEAYGFKYMPTHAGSVPPVVAPHHPRIDHLVIYAGSGMTDANFLSSIVGSGKAYGFSVYSHYSWLHRLCQRLLEGETTALALLGDNPFPNAPPKFVRVSLRALTPTSVAEQTTSGNYWHARHVGVAIPTMTKDPLVTPYWLAPPELLHPDFVHFRRRSKDLSAMLAALASSGRANDAVLTGSDLRADEVEAFWTHVVPAIAGSRGDLAGAAGVADALRERFGVEAMLRFERIAERFVFMLRTRIEPFFYGDRTPKLEKRSNFRFHALLQEIILDGREAFLTMLAQPEQAASRASRQTDATSLAMFAVFRWDAIRYHAQTLRIARPMTKTSEWPLPGILEFKDLLTALEPSEEAWLPECERRPSGDWDVHGFALAPRE
jgi:hypothetical protein